MITALTGDQRPPSVARNNLPVQVRIAQMIHYQISGVGDNWLVFVHGLTCDKSDWRQQLNAFEDHYRCLAVDLRGHGASSAMHGPLDIETHGSDVVQLICSLDIAGAVLVGHSMGTRVIASACVQAPERVGGLVFVDGSVQGKGDPWSAGETMSKTLANDADVPAFVQNLFSMMFTDGSDPDLKNNILYRASQMPVERFREQLRLMMMWDAGRFATVMSQIRVPLFIIQSTSVGADRVRHTIAEGGTTQYLKTLQQLAPHATQMVVPDCGHFTQLDAVIETNSAISEVAQQVFVQT